MLFHFCCCFWWLFTDIPKVTEEKHKEIMEKHPLLKKYQ